MIKFDIKQLEYAYTIDGLASIREANKNNSYFLDDNLTIPLVYCRGNKVIPYWRKKSNISEVDLKRVFGSSESIQHYNEKIRLSTLKSFTCKLLGIEYQFHSSKVEYRLIEINKTVDVAFFDKDGNIVLCIEVYYTNKKTTEDIDKFNKINVIIYEKRLQKGERGERCYPISAGKVDFDGREQLRSRIKGGYRYIQEFRAKNYTKRYKELRKEYWEIKEAIQRTKYLIETKEQRIRKVRSGLQHQKLLNSFKNGLSGSSWTDITLDDKV